MKVFRHIYNIGTRILALLLLFCWQACSTTDSDDPQQPSDGRVAVELALCVSAAQDHEAHAPAAPTRLSAVTVQNEDNFRGIQDLRLIPLNSEDAVCGDMLRSLSRVDGTQHYFSNEVTELNIGTSQFLCYARAIPADGAIPADNGGIDDSSFPASPSNVDLSAIRFIPSQISPNETDDRYGAANTMAAYLTTIATAKVSDDYRWDNADHKLGAYYKNFVNKLSGFKPIAGSTANVKAMVKQLKNNLEALELTGDEDMLRDNIITAIGDVDTQVTGDAYPGNLGLPDGAGALRWNDTEKKFEVIINAPESSTMPLSDHNRFAYPPELYYFIKSPIKTSTSQRESDYSETEWDDVLATYQTDNATVQTTTRSVAVKNPLDYAVGSMVVYIQAASASLEDNSQEAHDAEGGSTITVQDVALGTVGDQKFPLTGIQVDGQYQQTCEFLPVGDTKDSENHTVKAKEYIVYDKSISGVYLTADISSPAYSLAYQSRDDKPVDIVLEFQNNSGQDFYGYDNGIVYKNTKFYLIGQIWPDGESSVDKERRVFTKDHKTVLNLTIRSLKNAYNVIPDLKTAAYAVHVSNVAIRNWEDVTPVDHELYNW